MIKLGICDDVKMEQEQIEASCRSFFKKTEEVVEFVLFASGDEVIQYSGELDILLLKVEMDSMNGIQVKNHLEYVRSNTKIIFLSAYKERMQEAFGMNVCAFLEKPIQEEQLFQCMEKLWNHLYRRKLESQYEKEIEVGHKKIFTSDILYVESSRHYCELVCIDDRICIRKNIQKLEEELNSFMFVRCHRSYIVNLRYIKKIGKDIIMTNGESVMVSRSRRPLTEEKHKEYIKKWSLFDVEK